MPPITPAPGDYVLFVSDNIRRFVGVNDPDQESWICDGRVTPSGTVDSVRSWTINPKKVLGIVTPDDPNHGERVRALHLHLVNYRLAKAASTTKE